MAAITGARGGFKQASFSTSCFREIIAAVVWRKHYKGKQAQGFKSRSRKPVGRLLLASRNEGWWLGLRQGLWEVTRFEIKL